ncbi:MAG: nucleotidyltransferase domain-containing protein [Anaerolineales bacterium]|nr:MAG: nucleotidyltransferase domain-containing protein [Anaerolineales bacterium]
MNLTDADLKIVLPDLKKALRDTYGDRLVRLILFGSQARGQAGPESDVDVAVLVDGEIEPFREIDRLSYILADLNLRYGLLISVLPLSTQTLETAEGPFWRNLREQGVTI